MTSTQDLERKIGTWWRAHLPRTFAEISVFVLKQAWASIYAILLLVGIYGTSLFWQADWALARYDALVLWAVGLQGLLLLLKFETLQEAKVILLFHLIATVMEVYKVNAGSWHYPEEGVLKLYNVPLFSGFMYASVGSYIARVIRLFDMRFSNYPPFWSTVILAGAIYVNFFTHHFAPDLRWLLMALTLVMFLRTSVVFRLGETSYWLPLPVSALFSAGFIWLAENIGTLSSTWLYRGQSPQDWVSISKLGSWYLLLYVSFVSITLISRDALERAPARSIKENRATLENTPAE